MTTLHLRNSVYRSPVRLLLLISLVLAFFGHSPDAGAVCQETCLGSSTALGEDALISNTGFGNTAMGFNALFSNTTGEWNTALGYSSLQGNLTGSENTAVGLDALYSNTTGIDNTAVGLSALTYNTTGGFNTANGAHALNFNSTGDNNTAAGYYALEANTTGARNVATGASALHSNTTGIDNTATGFNALYTNNGSYNTAHGYKALEKNTSGSNNTANGLNALNKNTNGINNTANGASALYSNTSGSYNTANGENALNLNTNGAFNTADGYEALFNSSGGNNIAVGAFAGLNLTTGSLNIDIGNHGVAAEANTIRIGTVGSQGNTYIAGISGVAVGGGVGVIVDSNGHLGTVVSSARFKEAIKPMDKASEAILALRPVSFHYKKELDPEGIPQFGLVAEDVEMVNPDLVARDEQGKPYTVRYEAVNAMLLNEFLKEHCKNEEQQNEIESLKAALKEQAAQIQTMSVRLAEDKSTAHLAVNP